MTKGTERAVREITGTCLCRRTRALSRRITRLYDDALRELGLTANQLTLLAAVERSGEISRAALGERLSMEKSTVSRTTARMLAQGWLREVVESRGLVTTATGRRLLRRAHGPWRRAQAAAQDALGPDLARALWDG